MAATLLYCSSQYFILNRFNKRKHFLQVHPLDFLIEKWKRRVKNLKF